MHRLLPQTITAGLTFRLALCLSDYSEARWQLVLLLRGPGNLTLQGTHDGTRQTFGADFSQTSLWRPGAYTYSLRALDGVEVYELETGRLRILPNLAEMPDGYDGRTDARVALDAIEAVIGRRATLDQERYRINNRELYRTPIADLLRLRAHYVELVAREDAAAAGRPRFGRQLKFAARSR